MAKFTYQIPRRHFTVSEGHVPALYQSSIVSAQQGRPQGTGLPRCTCPGIAVDVRPGERRNSCSGRPDEVIPTLAFSRVSLSPFESGTKRKKGRGAGRQDNLRLQKSDKTGRFLKGKTHWLSPQRRERLERYGSRETILPLGLPPSPLPLPSASPSPPPVLPSIPGPHPLPCARQGRAAIRN